MNIRNVNRLFRRIAQALTIRDHAVEIPETPFVLFSCHDVDRSMQDQEGRYYSPLLEGIRQFYAELGYCAVNLTHPFAVRRGETVQGDSITLNYQALTARLKQRSCRPQDDAETAMYRKLLQRWQPSLIISIQPPAALCRAARGLGIRVIEAMHGTSYSLTDKIFMAHMEALDAALPNILLSFDDISERTLSTICKDRDIQAVRAQDPWSLYLRRTNPPLRIDRSEKNRQVLVTLQWGYDGERDSLSNIIPNGILHPALEAVMHSQADTRFLVRMHPIQMTNPGYRHHLRYIEKLATRLPNVEFERASREPLPLLLDEVDGHITMSSSAIGEAAQANVPSLALCPTLKEGGAHFGFYRDLPENTLTYGSLDAAAIEQWIGARQAVFHIRSHDLELDHARQLLLYASLVPAKSTVAGGNAS